MRSGEEAEKREGRTKEVAPMIRLLGPRDEAALSAFGILRGRSDEKLRLERSWNSLQESTSTLCIEVDCMLAHLSAFPQQPGWHQTRFNRPDAGCARMLLAY